MPSRSGVEWRGLAGSLGGSLVDDARLSYRDFCCGRASRWCEAGVDAAISVCVEKCELLVKTFVFEAVVEGPSWVRGWE